ncbi:MAG: glycerol-3-phosphate dehydrogenase [Pseudomonadota bacterium]|jgi:glycerol-3-phosphate dehydrogenase
MQTFDLLVIGGGINGTGIAADAAGRGLSVALCEKDDLASATSSASTKLIHGGLRYLETYEFGLVRKALKESETLLHLAPHVIHPICFHLPYEKHHRPWLLIRLGLFLYNTLAYRPSYKTAGAVRFPADSPLDPSLRHGFRIYDGWVDDSRLVVLNALQAARKSARIMTRTECTALAAGADGWTATLLDHVSGEQHTVQARAVINATGPWVSDLVSRSTGQQPALAVRLVKGSHIVVPLMQPGNQAYLLQNEDRRVIFVIPYEQRFTLIGTTEEEFTGDPAAAAISNAEVDYLIGAVNKYFKKSIARHDVVHTYSGVRPLIDSKQALARKVSRDYRLEFEKTPQPLLSVYGGKITTYRLLAKQAVDKLGSSLPGMKRSRTRKAVLPGGDFKMREQLFQIMASANKWIRPDIIKRWIHAYGNLAFDILRNTNNMADMGMNFGNGLFQREVDYLVEHEWARSADDILWRRTKLGLLFSTEQQAELDHYLRDKVAKQDIRSRTWTS